jgi:two-component system alkaline phosphatase synthesis response regulator PhoP
MSKRRILVVDDEADIRELVRLNLTREGYEVLECEAGEPALDLAHATVPDLIVLDLMLPGIDGLTVCKRLKADPRTAHIPVVILTAKGEEADIVAGLEVGADDYVVKPFSGKVLAARVRRLLRKGTPGPDEPGGIRVHDLIIDASRHEVWARDQKVDLTRTEFNILRALTRRPGLVLSRYQIVDAVHGSDYPVTDRAVDVQIVSLRKKLGPCGEYIETVRGVGYRFRD